jgi:uncharacterized membrane protein
MRSESRPRSRVASVVFDVLDPIPYGFFVGGLVFDAVYAKTAEILWLKGAAWLISIGLVVAVVPRLINLAQVWFPGSSGRAPHAMASFWLSLLAIAAAILNAFVHSRDAFAVMPEGLWLSVLTVVLFVIARAVPAMQLLRDRTTA